MTPYGRSRYTRGEQVGVFSAPAGGPGPRPRPPGVRATTARSALNQADRELPALAPDRLEKWDIVYLLDDPQPDSGLSSRCPPRMPGEPPFHSLAAPPHAV